MGRTKGSKNKAGRPPGAKNAPSAFKNVLPKLSPVEILEIKQAIITLLTNGTCQTIAAACRKLEIDPQKVSSWAYADPDFKKARDAAYQILADNLEEDLAHYTGKHPIPAMMILKRIRKEYRDNHQAEEASGALEKLLTELAKLAAVRVEQAKLPAPNEPKVIDTTFTIIEELREPQGETNG